MVSLGLMCVYLGEVSVNLYMVLNDDFLSCILKYFPNEIALSFDVVSIILSVCVIFLCVWLGGGGVRFGILVFGLYAVCL